MSIGNRVRVAIETECSAIKAGNVHPYASFQDLNYGHFLTAAKAIGEQIDSCAGESIGQIALKCVAAMMNAVGTNTSLGTILLMAPLVVATNRLTDRSTRIWNLEMALTEALSSMTPEDSHDIFQAIRLAKPGGLGESQSMDIREAAPLDIRSAMRIASNWDDVALQYVTDFELVLSVSRRIESKRLIGLTLLDSIRCIQMELLGERVDSLIARKQGPEFARQVQARAIEVIGSGPYGDVEYERAWQVFDAELRDDGHRGNPGTIADLIAVALY
jgi:triphosphoribosyl-dephospho-CoA synthase